MTMKINQNYFSGKTVTGKSVEESDVDAFAQEAEGTISFFENLGTGGNPKAESSTDPLEIVNKLVGSSKAVNVDDLPDIEIPVAETVVKNSAAVEPLLAATPAFYDDLEATYLARKEDILGAIEASKTAIQYGQDILLNKAYIEKYKKALNQIEKEMAKIPALKEKCDKVKNAEFDALQEIGKKLATKEEPILDEADLDKLDKNGDGLIGPDGTWAIGSKEIEGKMIYVIMDAKTRKAITKFDEVTGLPKDGNTIEGDYSFTLTSSGLKMVSADNALTDEDLILSLDASKYQKAAMPPDISIPEYILVKTDDEGVPLRNGDDGFVVVPFTTGPNGAINQTLPDPATNVKKILVQKVSVSSDQNGPAIKPKGWKPEDGTDTLIVLKGPDDTNSETTLATIRIQSVSSKSGVYANKGFIAASSVGLALSGSQRTSPIEIDAGNFHSSGTFSLSEKQKKDLYLKWNLDKNDPNLAANMEAFQSGQAGWTSDDTLKTGVMITDMPGGLFKLDTAHNLIQVADISEDIDQYNGGEERNPLYQTFVDGSAGINAVFGGRGDHVLKQVSVAKIRGDEGDNNFVLTQDAGNTNGFYYHRDTSDGDYSTLARDYIDISGKKGAQLNEVGIAVADMDDYTGNDTYKVGNRQSLLFQGDLDGGSDDPAYEYKKINDVPEYWDGTTEYTAETFMELAPKVASAIRGGLQKMNEAPEDPYADMDGWETVELGEYATQQQAVLNEIFAEFRAFGLTSEKEDPDADDPSEPIESNEVNNA